MKNKIKIYKNLWMGSIASLLLLVTSVFVLTSCIDYDNNINPHKLTEDDLDKDNLRVGGFFTTMQRDILATSDEGANAYQRAQNLIGDTYGGFMSPIGGWNSGKNGNTYYLYFDDWRNVAFDNSYTKVMTPWLEIKKNTEENPAVRAMADIVKVMAMHRIVDIYGPIPYSKFGQSSIGNSYDSERDIYMMFFEELNLAIEELSSFALANESGTLLANYDLIYAGSVEKWLKLANSLKLRLAMRISFVEPILAKQYAEEAVNNEYGVFTDVDDCAYLGANPTAGIVFHPLVVISEDYEDTRMSASMDSFMNGYNDPRLDAYFKKSTYGTFNGVRQGIIIRSKEAYKSASKPNVKKTDKVKLMGTSEVYFLRAEGSLNGWSMGGSAKELYNKGIEMSFNEAEKFTSSGVSIVAKLSEYINDETSKPIRFTDKFGSSSIVPMTSITIKWNDSDSKEKQLERIITQKWIALFPEGQEAWSEFRRTGYPKLFPVVTNNSNGLINTSKHIRRMVYPQGEYDNNINELEKGIQLLKTPSDNGGVQLWWDVK